MAERICADPGRVERAPDSRAICVPSAGGFRAVQRSAGVSDMEEYGGEQDCLSVTLASCPPDEFVRAVVVEEV